MNADRIEIDPHRELQIRAARLEDLPEIDAIYNHYVTTSTCTFQIAPGTIQDRRAWFDEHGEAHPILVAVEHGPPERAVIGWASLSAYKPREGYARTVELSVYIRDDKRGYGLGRRLVRTLLDRAHALGHHVVIGTVACDQPESIGLHKALGFREAGRLREVGYKFGKWIDCVVFEHVFDASA